MRRIVWYLGAVVVIAVVLVASAWVYLSWGSTPSSIVDFRPTTFDAKADKAFFYSIANELKHSDEINPRSPTLLRGEIRDFLVSPDDNKIAVVADRRLAIVMVGQDGPTVREVVPVDSIYRKPKPLGRQFYRDDDFQWSRDSGSLYVIRDEFYESKGSQLFSSKGELWKYDVPTGRLQLVLKPFPAYTYFFGRNAGIYFSVPTDNGDLRLRYFDGNHSTDIGDINASTIPVDKLSAPTVETPFYSFSSLDYERIVLREKGFELSIEGQPPFQTLKIAGKPFLVFTQGQGIKGPFYCSDSSNSVFLPGDRYFLLNTYCRNYDGQVLIDTASGNYQKLPLKTHVYLAMNTATDLHYRISSGGMLPY